MSYCLKPPSKEEAKTITALQQSLDAKDCQALTKKTNSTQLIVLRSKNIENLRPLSYFPKSSF